MASDADDRERVMKGPSMYERMVVGTDLSETSRIAVARASRLAERLGADLVIVYAGPDPGEELRVLAAEYGGRALVDAGSPADVLVTKTTELGAGLLVVGSVGMSGPRRFLLGNVPNKVSHHATTDLLIVKTEGARAGERGDYKKLLIGTDGSRTATRAVDAGAGLAKRIGADVTIVCAYQPPSEQELARMRADPEDPIKQWNAPREERQVPKEFKWRIAGAAEAEDVLQRAVDHAAAHGVDADVRALEGHPADTLIRLAKDEDFDAIAVGSVGMTGSQRFMLGNVPHHVSHHSPTDVLILRTQ